MKLNLNILLVSSDPDLTGFIKVCLSQIDHQLEIVDSVEAFEDEYTSSLDVCLVDVGSIRGGAFEFCKRLREVHPHAGLICIHPSLDLPSRLQSWNSGADHVICQPLEAEEFKLLTQQLIRRLQTPLLKPQAVNNDSFRLVLSSQKRSISGPLSEEALTSTEYLLLQSLARAKNKSLELWQIYDLLGKTEETLQKPAIEAQIYRLRKKLRDSGAGNQALKSVRLKGYQLCASIWIS